MPHPRESGDPVESRSTRLYLISPPSIELAAFRNALHEALQAGQSQDSRFRGNNRIGSFQLRLKDSDDATIIKATKELMPICRAHEVAFIINDRPDLCASLKADGIHLGQEDLINAPAIASWRSHGAGLKAGAPADAQSTLKIARDIIGPDAVIGVSCHASKHLGMEAGEAGADYVAFGAFYETQSKPMEKLLKWGTPTAELLEWWQAYMALPCVAIGGITPSNCKPLAAAGADFLAVITAVWKHPAGPAAAIKEFEKELGDEN